MVDTLVSYFTQVITEYEIRVCIRDEHRRTNNTRIQYNSHMCSKIFPINHQNLYSPPSRKVNIRYHTFLLFLSQTGSNFTIQTLVAHRHSFIGESDLSAISSLGLQMVRLPITWAAFADALAPLDQKIYASHDPKKETVIAAGVNFKEGFFCTRKMLKVILFP